MEEKAKIIQKYFQKLKWKKNDTPILVHHFLEANCSKYRYFSYVEFSELFIGDDIVIFAKTQMTKYSHTKNWLNLNVSITKLKVFITTQTISGYNVLSQKLLYWSKTSDNHITLLAMLCIETGLAW